MAAHVFNIINAAKNMRSDLTVFILSHIENGTDLFGNRQVKIKTIGKLLDEKIVIEGLFNIVLMTSVEKTENGFEYMFQTQADGLSTVKSPMGMFDAKIPNDLQLVIDTINKYEEGE